MAKSSIFMTEKEGHGPASASYAKVAAASTLVASGTATRAGCHHISNYLITV
jgi:hypothetical protein